MLLKDFIPATDVQEFVQLYRIVHLRFQPEQQVPFKAYPPRPEHCLAFYPYDTETVVYQNSGKTIENIPIVLYGQFSEVTNRLINHQFLVFQIIFYPGALYRLTGMPAAELNNQYIDATTVFSSDLVFINEQLYHAANYTEMLHIANHFVRGLIKKQRKSKLLMDEIFPLLLKGEMNYSLQQIASMACLSTKQLERRFKERTGVNPKLYQRIIQFDKAFRLKNSFPDLDGLRIALECGYHDYQHLSKAYKDFTGLSPTEFEALELKAPERHFGLTEGYYS